MEEITRLSLGKLVVRKLQSTYAVKKAELRLIASLRSQESRRSKRPLQATSFDSAFFGAFNGGIDSARPFVGSLQAPSSSVGIFAADACALFNACVTSASNPTALLSLNAINATPAGAPPTETTVTNNQVRFIVNGERRSQCLARRLATRRAISTRMP